MSPSIDVIIPTFERWELTRHCLEHLRGQTVEHTAFVVDNGSTDGTVENIRTDFPEVRLVASERGAGFPAACNRGVNAGTGDIVVLLNNDVECAPDFLQSLAEPLHEHATIGSSAAVLVRPGGTTIDSVGLTADPTLTGFPRLRGRPASDAAAKSPVLTGPVGAGGAYRRTAWEEVGGLDEHVLFYGEDLDLALRLRSAGWETVAIPEAVAVHLGSATAGNRSAWQRYQGGFARGYFLRRYAVLRTAAGPRAMLTEATVVAGDAVISRDLSALRGRWAGWRAGRDVPRLPMPPAEATDPSIGLLESFRLRRVVYAS